MTNIDSHAFATDCIILMVYWTTAKQNHPHHVRDRRFLVQSRPI
jgi:hypothetical protein